MEARLLLEKIRVRKAWFTSSSKEADTSWPQARGHIYSMEQGEGSDARLFRAY